MPNVDTIIPSYNALEMLNDCLEAVDMQYDPTNCVDNYGNIIIVHNSPKQPKMYQPKVTTFREITNEENNGFTQAINQGIRLGLENGADYFWVLNQDAVPQEGAMDALVKRMEESPKCGVVSSMICEATRPDHIVFGGATAVIPGIHKSGWKSEGNLQKPTLEPWVTFCSVLIRREMLIEIGLLDENFWLICSDSDFCLTARSKGWEIWYEPTSEVWHSEKHGSSRVGSETRTKEQEQIMGEDQRKFLEKWRGELFRDLCQEVLG